MYTHLKHSDLLKDSERHQWNLSGLSQIKL